MSTLPLRLTHYAAEPLTALDGRWTDLYREAARLDRSTVTATGKPRGLWVSVDDDGEGWADWCQAEGFGLGRLTVMHDVTLAGDARILRVDTAAGLDEFTSRYRALAVDDWPPDLAGIDWPRVADDWQGIVIAPYQWSRRLTLLWYYGWDCASGCIWDVSAVAEIRPRVEASPR